jgi:hypothetical protein
MVLKMPVLFLSVFSVVDLPWQFGQMAPTHRG